MSKLPHVPPPPQPVEIIPLETLPPLANLEQSKGTFVVEDLESFYDLGFRDCRHEVLGPNPNGYYVLLVSSLPKITKQQLLDAKRRRVILDCDVDIPKNLVREWVE